VSYQVFIERCRDNNQETAQHLARAVAERYKIDPTQILSRLQRGRFRVKSNLDLDSARVFMSFLEDKGALCSIVNTATGEVVERSTAMAPTLMGRPSPASDFPVEQTNEFALHTPPPGSLSPVSSPALGSFQLEHLDGSSDEPEEARASPAEYGDNAFLPPELQDDAAPLVVDAPARRSSANIEAQEEPDDIGSAEAQSQQEPPPPPKDPLAKQVLTLLGSHWRARFGVGVLLAVLLGYVVMSFVASGREASRYSHVIAELEAEYDAADTIVAWEALDDARAVALKTLEKRRLNIIIMAVIVWLVVAGLFALLWLRVIDWSRWQAPVIAKAGVSD
jgi:hypothetical protein